MLLCSLCLQCFETSYECYDNSNVSVAAPPSVPYSASVAVAAGGDDGRKAYMAGRFGPSGEGQTGVIPPNPNLHGNVNVCY